MDGINHDIDNIIAKTSELLDTVFAEFNGQDIRPSTHSSEIVTLWIVFHLSRAYFLGARDALKNRHLLTGAMSVRSNIENISDLLYIFRNQKTLNKYAPAYVKSMQTYQTVVKDVAGSNAAQATADRKLKQVNRWAGASIDARLSLVGNSIATVYDMLSYFSHPNPAAIDFLGKPLLREAQINLVQQGNCITLLFILALIVNHGPIQSVSLGQLNDVGKQLGVDIIPSTS